MGNGQGALSNDSTTSMQNSHLRFLCPFTASEKTSQLEAKYSIIIEIKIQYEH